MDTRYWVAIAAAYFALAIASFFFSRRIDAVYKRAKADFESDYGFRTYDIFGLIQKYAVLSTWISVVGAVLAGIAALLSL